MKRLSRILGVTLLEIMLVLAIAAMVIVMSIRYYSSASGSQQTNDTMAQIQAITAAMDNLAVGVGTYIGITAANIQAVAGANSLTTDWNSTITVTPATATTYTVSIPNAPVAVCNSVAQKLKASSHYTTPGCAGSTISYTYDSTK